MAGPATVLAALALAAPAGAITPTISEFGSGLGSSSTPAGITAGSDSALWFGDSGAGAIGRSTTGGTITELRSGLPSGSRPSAVALGPAGDIWFTDNAPTPAIGRIDPAGNVTEFHTGLHSDSVLSGITQGPDGNLWFTDNGPLPAIGRITPTGTIHEFSLPASSSPAGISGGADGNIWFADAGTPAAIGRITPVGDIHEFTLGLGASSRPAGIAAGPDGNLWFTDRGTPPAIGRATTGGTIAEFRAGLQAGSRPRGIAAGPDGALWFADAGSSPAIGRVTPDGAISEFAGGLAPGSAPSGISSGPDGNVWFTDAGSVPQIGMITTPPAATTLSAVATGATTAAVLGSVDGHAQHTSFHIDYGFVGGSIRSTRRKSIGTTIGPTHVAGALTRLRPSTTYQARIVGTNGTDSTGGAFITFTTAPPPDRITRLRIRPRSIIAAAHGGSVARRRRGRAGATIIYNGTQPARTTFFVERITTGRRSGRRCVALRRGNRFARPCRRLVRVGRFSHIDVVGVNRFRFTGRIRNRKLPRGSYLLVAVPRSAGGVGRTVRVSFRVKR